MMKRLILFCVALFLSASVFAQENASSSSVNQLLEVSNSKMIHEAVMKDFGKMVEQSMQNTLKEMPAEKQQQFKESLAEIEKLVQEEMSWEKIKPEYVKIYQETYTQKEINDLIRFYKTPSGKSFIKKQPQLIERSSQMAVEKMSIVLERFSKSLSTQ